ncbi:hypothetical protein NIIDNTM18_53510 [Mycolicibacterium litorale]|uniref:Uncharacterized protein n=1 Tax=Mycolicibacterium litorale TaxID=758802 RepID=A0A6S6P866_9MYCO|nr:hypothetical protein NIIDNTM18_53510 [Mycolicibacterium litorale]
MQAADTLMTASVGSTIFGSSRSSTRMSPGAYMTTPRMVSLLTAPLGEAFVGDSHVRVPRTAAVIPVPTARRADGML